MRQLTSSDWFSIRVAYRVALLGYLALVSFQIGPTLFNYGRVLPPSPADFTELVNRECVPIVQAMVAHHRDTREWPVQTDQMIPKYLPKAFADQPVWTNRDGGLVFPMFRKRLRVHYTPRPGGGEWSIEGPHLQGTVPATPVPEYQPLSDDNAGHQ